MREYLELGSVPFGENCVQVGADDYYTKYREESNRYIEQLKHRFPEINNVNCYFSIKGFPHEFGTYHEVVINYNDNDDAAINFAFFVENNLPEYWNDNEVLLYEAPSESEYI